MTLKLKTTNELVNINSKFKRALRELISANLCDRDEAIRYSFEFTEGRCFYCGNKLYTTNEAGDQFLTKDASLDHIVPASALGLIAPGNIALCCDACNKAKADMPVLDYYRLRKTTNKVVLYDSELEFTRKLNAFQERYFLDWPLYAILNEQIQNGAMEEVSLETVLKCLTVNSDDKAGIMLPLKKTEAAVEGVRVPGAQLSISEQGLNLVNEALKSTLKTGKLAVEKERRECITAIQVLEDNYPDFCNIMFTEERATIDSMIKNAKCSFNFNVEEKCKKTLTLIGYVNNAKNLLFNDNYVLQLKRGGK